MADKPEDDELVVFPWPKPPDIIYIDRWPSEFQMLFLMRLAVWFEMPEVPMTMVYRDCSRVQVWFNLSDETGQPLGECEFQKINGLVHVAMVGGDQIWHELYFAETVEGPITLPTRKPENENDIENWFDDQRVLDALNAGVVKRIPFFEGGQFEKYGGLIRDVVTTMQVSLLYGDHKTMPFFVSIDKSGGTTTVSIQMGGCYVPYGEPIPLEFPSPGSLTKPARAGRLAEVVTGGK